MFHQVVVEGCVSADDGNLFDYRLRNDEPVKRELSASHLDFYHKHVKTVRRNLTLIAALNLDAPPACGAKATVV
jgi:hypothetical protein